jgi:hypothetical protein
MATTEDKID